MCEAKQRKNTGTTEQIISIHSAMDSQTPGPEGLSIQDELSTADLVIHTYHCLCSTLLLTTPYALSELPMRASTSGDQARILPLPTLSLEKGTTALRDDIAGVTGDGQDVFLASSLANTRPARKALVVQREDGYEKRRMWRCNRCALGWGYEIEVDADIGGDERKTRTLYLPEGGLVETGEMKEREQP